jgi:NTE family protein
MELQLDTTKIYAIALEGGGARGAYQVGAWRALEDAGIRYNAVSGTSVGALNGAMMAMRDLANAEKLWKDIRFSQVMNVDDETMDRIMKLDFENFGQVKTALRTIRDIIRAGGMDVEPLRNLLAEWVDEEKIRSSGVEFFLPTYSLTDREALEVVASELPEGELPGMLLASAYFPAFKQEQIGGKNYTDGGFVDSVPITPLVKRGYKDLIVIRLNSIGVERRVKLPEDATVITIAPKQELGNMMNFSSELSAVNMALGYYDTQKVLYGLVGETYYIDRTLSEQDAYELLLPLLFTSDVSLRRLNEEILPKLCDKLRIKGDYYDLFLCIAERLAESCSLTPFRIRTDREFWDEVLALRSDEVPDKPDKILDLFLNA